MIFLLLILIILFTLESYNLKSNFSNYIAIFSFFMFLEKYLNIFLKTSLGNIKVNKNYLIEKIKNDYLFFLKIYNHFVYILDKIIKILKINFNIIAIKKIFFIFILIIIFIFNNFFFSYFFFFLIFFYLFISYIFYLKQGKTNNILIIYCSILFFHSVFLNNPEILNIFNYINIFKGIFSGDIISPELSEKFEFGKTIICCGFNYIIYLNAILEYISNIIYIIIQPIILYILLYNFYILTK